MIEKGKKWEMMHANFLASKRKQVLMISNHGMHEWQVIAGLPDTGGQNVFVNQFSDALAKRGYKITVVNRGGFEHPVHKAVQRGFCYKNDFERIFYVEDTKKEFIRKEEMKVQLQELAVSLKNFMASEKSRIDFIISHYWDGAGLGHLFNRMHNSKYRHFWVPHSLGEIKKRNMNSSLWAGLRIDERIKFERELLPHLQGIAATSGLVKKSLEEDYGIEKPLFLPPCIDTNRFKPFSPGPEAKIWFELGKSLNRPAAEISNCMIITEISRTDGTKRKDLLLRAFARVQREFSSTILVITIDDNDSTLSIELKELIKFLKIEQNVAVCGSITRWLPQLYAATDIYCTPSEMEGFGMSIQEATASAVPAVASDLVPFATEYLLGKEYKSIDIKNGSDSSIKIGEGGIIVPAGNEDGFTLALKILLQDENLRKKMGENAYNITIPYFTWENMTADFLKKAGLNS
ncbi:glycosyltransferase [Candidatus Riflebacteria bacterium]